MKELYKAKQALRKDMAVLKRSYTQTALQTLSCNIGRRIEENVFFRQASCVALYYALPGEVGTAGILEKWYRSKRLLLPVVKGENLQFRQYRGRDFLQKGTFNIWEPDEECPVVHTKEINLILVPGVAFDHTHNRLGRGKGFYDRILADLTVPKIGICFDFQLKEQIPAGTSDIKMDLIITEKESI